MSCKVTADCGESSICVPTKSGEGQCIERSAATTLVGGGMVLGGALGFVGGAVLAGVLVWVLK